MDAKPGELVLEAAEQAGSELLRGCGGDVFVAVGRLGSLRRSLVTADHPAHSRMRHADELADDVLRPVGMELGEPEDRSLQLLEP